MEPILAGTKILETEYVDADPSCHSQSPCGRGGPYVYGPAARGTASRCSSFPKAFLPSKRCSCVVRAPAPRAVICLTLIQERGPIRSFKGHLKYSLSHLRGDISASIGLIAAVAASASFSMARCSATVAAVEGGASATVARTAFPISSLVAVAVMRHRFPRQRGRRDCCWSKVGINLCTCEGFHSPDRSGDATKRVGISVARKPSLSETFSGVRSCAFSNASSAS